MNILSKNTISKIFQNQKKMWAKLTIFMALFLLPNLAYGAYSKEDLERQIAIQQKNLRNTAIVKDNLQDQIAQYNGQINYLENEINYTGMQISTLSSELSKTQKEIINTQIELDKTKGNLSGLILSMYKESRESTIERIAKSKTFSDFVNKNEYFEKTQASVKDVGMKVISLRDSLIAKKTRLTEAKKENEDLINQKNSQQQEILSQKSIKDQLLAETKGDEAAYKRKIAILQEQLDRLNTSIWGTGNLVTGLNVPVKKGQIIGYIGNSGYTLGSYGGYHLHFEVRKGTTCSRYFVYECYANPVTYINKYGFIKPTPKNTVTTGGFGEDYGAGLGRWRYHTGVDYAASGWTAKYQKIPVYAAADGIIIKRQTGRTRTSSPDYGNYVMIKHANNTYSFYAHMR